VIDRKKLEREREREEDKKFREREIRTAKIR